MPRASHLSDRPPEIIAVPINLRGQFAMTLQVDKSKVSRRWANSADGDFYEALGHVVVGWDLTNDDDSPYELSIENWVSLGLGFDDEFELVEQIVRASVPSRAEGNDSTERQSTPPIPFTGPEQTSPNGPATLPSPTPSESPSPT